ncbi:hypothetical protein F5883DRAFT_363751, partial [Diaporthe sp. PMI_573]
RYDTMVLESYDAPQRYNVAAAVSLWTLLAGFIVLPATFTSLESVKVNNETSEILHGIAEPIPLLCLSAVCCLTGLVGTILLWIKFRHNYVWLLGHLFGPGLLNATSGLITVLVGVYASHNGEWSMTA